MTFRLSPQEGPHVADSNQYVIRTRVPYREVTDEMIAQRVAAVGLKVGDLILVQCYDHNYAMLLHETDYRVISRHEEIKVVQLNDRDSKQFNAVSYLVARRSPWWSSPAGAVEDAAEAELLGPDLELTVQWNPGKRVHQVLRDGVVIAEDRDKATATEKATQHA